MSSKLLLLFNHAARREDGKVLKAPHEIKSSIIPYVSIQLNSILYVNNIERDSSRFLQPLPHETEIP